MPDQETQEPKAEAPAVEKKDWLKILSGHVEVDGQGPIRIKDSQAWIKVLLEFLGADDSEVTRDIFYFLSTIYSGAINHGPCPCGSGKEFKGCCKDSWNLIQRYHNGWKNDQENAKSKPEEIDPDVDWVCKIGLHKRGGAILSPIASKPITQQQMIEILNGLADSMREQNIVARAKAEILQALRPSPQLPPILTK